VVRTHIRYAVFGVQSLPLFPVLFRWRRLGVNPQRFRDLYAADREAKNRCECRQQCGLAAEVKQIRKYSEQRAGDARDVQPKRSAPLLRHIAAQSKLKQQGRKPDGGDNYQRQGAEEGRASRVDHHQGQCQQQ